MYIEPFEWELGFSKHLLIVILLTHFGAFCITALLVPNLILKILFMAAIIGHTRKIIRAHVFRSTARSIVKLWQESNGRFGCQFKIGQSAYGDLQGDSFKSFFCVIVRLKLSQRSVTLIVPRDCVSTPVYRILCSRLRKV